MASFQESYRVDTPRFAEMNNLTAGQGAEILFATDDWFAAAENLTRTTEPVFKDGLFTSEGKWMDGWETRRKRIPGHDWCIIKLEFAKFPPRATGAGKAAEDHELKTVKSLKTERWTRITPMSRLRPGYKPSRHNFVPVSDRSVYNVVRLNAYPDGGIARLNVFGHAYPDWSAVKPGEVVDLILAKTGGVCVAHSNAHYGHPRNLIAPGRGANMGDGWETARRLDRPAILEADARGVLRVPGQEWAIFRLGHRGSIMEIEIDTCHFKGNFPDAVKVDACDVERYTEDHLDTYYNWTPILHPQKMQPHHQHLFQGDDILPHAPMTYVRITMSPDGGISRVRINGTLQFDRFQTWTHGIESVTQSLSGNGGDGDKARNGAIEPPAAAQPGA
ncbi:allantoicase-like isoform X2 [Pollicipes pollicipes]|uniref:allantoicase-like isoform X2 n=1 Tax=Pollicipes pollicipes TaxID=41117 RepID=UPI001884CA4E|nr:allantoicase-like isoform X2 [Pollicipes pollicipes]